MPPRIALRIAIDPTVELDESFVLRNGKFSKDGVMIDETGVAVKDMGPAKRMVTLDHLEFLEVLGRGASSYVQLVRNKTTGECVALKVINMFEKAKRDQLIREIRALHDADCPCLIGFYGAFYREGSINIALEYMDRGSLDQQGTLPEFVLANITYQILFALAYLKHENRVHRDIKPQNILINSEGCVKLSDFGISKELENSVGMCMTMVGTFKYMSPERMQAHKYSFSSDIWSLGIVLLECVAGVHPYTDCTTAVEMIQSVRDRPAPTLPEPDDYSPEFREFISMCVQKDPLDRLPADMLLASPWLVNNGATSLGAAVENVRDWLETEGAHRSARRRAK